MSNFKDTARFHLKSLNEEKEVLTEGIVLFKASKRIQTLIEKIEKRGKGVPEVEEVIDRLKDVYNKMDILEKRYSLESNKILKSNIRGEYETLNKKYYSLIKIVNNRAIVKVLKEIGALGLVAGAIVVGYYAIVSNPHSISDVAKVMTDKDSETPGIVYRGVEGVKGMAKSIASGDKIKDYSKPIQSAISGLGGELGKKSTLDAVGRKEVLEKMYGDAVGAQVLLRGGAVANGLFYGAATASVTSVVGIFNKMIKKIRGSNELYQKTKNALNKIKNEE